MWIVQKSGICTVRLVDLPSHMLYIAYDGLIKWWMFVLLDCCCVFLQACLHCEHVACGRYINNHMLEHYAETQVSWVPEFISLIDSHIFGMWNWHLFGTGHILCSKCLGNGQVSTRLSICLFHWSTAAVTCSQFAAYWLLVDIYCLPQPGRGQQILTNSCWCQSSGMANVTAVWSEGDRRRFVYFISDIIVTFMLYIFMLTWSEHKVSISFMLIWIQMMCRCQLMLLCLTFM